MDAKIHDFQGKTIRLNYGIPTNFSKQDLDAFVIESLFLFTEGLVDLHTAHLWSSSYNTDNDFFDVMDDYSSYPFWMLQQQNISEAIQLRHIWINEKVIMVEEVSFDSIMKLLNDSSAINDTSDSKKNHTWKQLIFDTTTCCSDLPINHFGKEKITVLDIDGMRMMEYPLENRNNKLWVAGPLYNKSLSSPIEISIINSHGGITFDVFLRWSFWTDSSMPGYHKVQSAIKKLLDNGWEN